jgi:amino acid permease
MEVIMKIPFLLASFSAIITGLFCFFNRYNTNQTCIRMIVAMIIFYIIGTVIKLTGLEIIKEEENKRLEIERKEREEREQKELEEKRKSLKEEETLGSKLNLVADDEFSPLDMTQAIRTKMNE